MNRCQSGYAPRMGTSAETNSEGHHHTATIRGGRAEPAKADEKAALSVALYEGLS